MTTHVLRVPQTVGFGALRLAFIALGLVALALIVAAMASSSGSATVSGKAVTSGRAVAVTQPANEVPPGSGIAFGRYPK